MAHWTECVKALADYEVQDRFSFPAAWGGPNCVEEFTYSDVSGAIGWIITYPGDYVLSSDVLSSFFEIQQPVIGHTASYVFGWGVLILVGLLSAPR